MDQATIVQEIAALEKAIARWYRTQSQSNAGAMMDLRDMKKELAALKAKLNPS